MEGYEELKESFIKSLPKNGEDNEELIKGFNSFLSDTVYYVKKLRPQYKDNTHFINEIVVQRAEYITNLSLNAKRSYLIKDLMFERLKDLSNQIYEEAVKKAKGEKIEFNEDKYSDIRKELDDVLKQVKPFNKSEANNIYSETILEIAYLSGEDITSLRIGHIIRSLKDEGR